MSETNSLASSQRTVASSRTRLGVRLFSTSIPIFPIFLALESDFHMVWSYIGLAIQFIQILGFVLNPHLNHGETLHYVSYGVYAFHLPFWDRKWVGNIPWFGYIIMWAVGVLFIFIFSVILVVVVMTKRPAVRKSLLFRFLRLATHGATSIFLIPLSSGLFSQMVCFESNLWTFPNVQCFTASTTVVFVLSLLAFTVLGFCAYAVETTLFVEGYSNPHPLARKHYLNDFSSVTWKLMSVMLFHLFLSNSTQNTYTYYWVPMYIALSSAIMSITYMVLLPYVHQTTNRLFAIAYLIAAIAGIAVYFSSLGGVHRLQASTYDGTMLAKLDVDWLILLIFGSLMVLVGWILADLRINRELLESLPQVFDAASPFPKEYTLLYPKGLPDYDVIYSSTMELCNEVGDGVFLEGRSQVSLEIPYLRRILVYTDAEVSTRFIPLLEKLTGHYPTKEMLHLATRIYIKALYRYPSNVTILVCFAAMISEYTSKPSLALTQCERTNVIPSSISSRYRAYRLLSRLKAQLRLRDAAYQHRCEEAKRAHKEILIRLHLFWNKLVSQYDNSQLETSFSAIAQRRMAANAMFKVALQHQSCDRELLLKYADFLEQVMMEKSTADNLRHFALQETEQQYGLHGTRGMQTQGQEQSYAKLVKKNSERHAKNPNTFCGARIDGLAFWKIIIIGLLFCVGTAFLAVAIVAENWETATLNCVRHSATARTLRIQGDLVAMQYWSTQELFEKSGTRLHAISSISQDLLYIHDFLTGGLPTASSSTRESFFTRKLVLNTLYSGSGIKHASVSFMSLGFHYATHLNDIAGVIARSNVKASSEEATYVEVAAAKASLTDPNGVAWGTSAYNASVQVCKNWHGEMTRNTLLLFCFLFFVGFIGVAMFAQLSTMLNTVEKFKSCIITLITLIPPKKVHEIADQAKKKVELFDATQGAEDENFQLQEVEAEAPQQAEEEREENEEDKGGASKNDETAEGTTDENYELEGEDDPLLREKGQQPFLRRDKKKNTGRVQQNLPREGPELNDQITGVKRNTNYSGRAVEILLYCIITSLLIASVVMSVWSVPRSLSELSNSNVVTRIGYYKDAQGKIIATCEAACAYFGSGVSTLLTQTLVDAEEFRSVLPLVLNYFPSENEVESLLVVASSMDTAQDLLVGLMTFSESISGATSQWDPTTNTVPTNAIGEGARQAIFGGSPCPVIELVMNMMNSTQYAVGLAADQQPQCISASARLNLLLGFIATCGVSSVLIILASILMFCHFGRKTSKKLSFALLGTFALAVLATVFGGLCYHSLSSMENTCWDFVSNQKVQSQNIQNCFIPLVYASSYVEQGEYAEIMNAVNYFDYTFDHPWETYASSLPEEYSSRFSSLMEECRMLEKIGISMVAHANSQNLVELSSFTWDFDTEPDAMMIRVMYPDDPLRYSTKTADFALDSTHLLMKAKDVLSNERILALVSEIRSIIESNYADQEEDFYQKIDRVALQAQVFLFLAVGSSSFAMLLFIAFLFFNVHVLLALSSLHQGITKNMNKHSFESTRLKVLLLLLLLLLGGVFALGVVTREYHSALVDQIDLVNARGFYVARSMLLIELWDSSSIPTANMQSSILSCYSQLDYIRQQVSSGSTNIFKLYSTLNEILLGQDVVLSPEFRYGYDYMVESEGMINSTDYTFPKGLENALAIWMQQILEVARNPTTTSSTLLVMAMRASVMQLLRGLDEVSDVLFTLSVQSMQTLVVVHILLIVAFMIVALSVIPIVLLPEAKFYAVEEEGYQMLIKLIPEDVKESIPAMRSFIARGLESGGYGHSLTDEIGIPTIAISASGIVTHFNRAAEETFGYAAAEVLGNNVSILMPTRIAKVHDTFLQKYKEMKPSNRQVLRDLEIQGKRNNNEQFPIRVTVNEVRLRDGSRAFIGFVLDIGETVVQTRKEELSRFVQEHLTLPMIAIDSLGTVLRFNRAAEECFGRSSAEVLDTNVKILMPEDIANRHDTYLATYLRTKKKHAIDNLTRTRAMRKNGTEFPVELMVREIKKDSLSTYIGFTRDLSDDQDLEKAIAIADSILKTSVTPIICTDMFGRIVSFSAAAEKAFGWTAKEVLDHNCKVLMPEMVADRHDEYLENYRTSWSKRAASIVDRTVMGRHKDGHLVPLHASLYEVKSSSANNSALVGFFKELTVTKSLENSLGVEQLAAENHRTPLVVADSKGIILQANRAALLEFGYVSEELIGSNLTVLMPQNYAEKHDAYLARYAETGVGSVVNNVRRFPAMRRNGTIFTAEISVREVRHEDGEPTYIGFIKNMEKEVRMSRQEAINEVILSHSATPLVAADATGRVVQCNEAAERLLHYRSGELVGENIETFLPNPVRASSSMSAFTLPLNQVILCEAITMDATTLPVRVTVKPVHIIPPHYVVLICDSREDNAVEVKRIRNAQIAAFSPIPLIQFKVDGTVTAFNIAAEKKFLWRREDAIGSHLQCFLKDSEVLSEILKPKEFNDFTDDFSDARALQTIAKMKNGKLFPVEMVVSEIETSEEAGKRSKSFLSYLTDMTEKVEDPSSAHLDLNPQPIITISQYGIIISCNVALAKLFRYPFPSSLIGLNVNVLMPPEVASLHDGYLVAYEKTKRKRKIGTTSVVKARRADDTFFSASLTVHEIKDEGSNDETIFMATMSDESVGVELSDAKQFTDALMSLCPNPLFVFDRNGVISVANDAASTVFLYPTREALLEVSLHSIIPDFCVEETGAVKPYLSDPNHLLLNHKRLTVAKRSDGSTFDAEVVLSMIRTKEFVHVIACATDMTKTTELLGHKMLNMAIATHSPIPVVIVDPFGTIKLFSAAAEKFYGYTAEEAVGSSMQLLMPPEEAAEHAKIMRQSNETGNYSNVGKKVDRIARLKSGELVPIQLNSKPVHSVKGGKSDFVGYVTDLRLKFELERCAHLAHTVQNSMPIPFVVVNANGTVADINNVAEKFFGYTANELRGQNCSLIVSTHIPNPTKPVTLNGVKVTTRLGVVKEADVAASPLVDPQRVDDLSSRYGMVFVDRSANNEYWRAKQRSEHLMEFTEEAVVCVDPKTANIVGLNECARQLLLCEELTSLDQKPLRTLIPDVDVTEKILLAAPRLSSTEPKEEFQTKIISADESIISASVTCEYYREEILLRLQDLRKVEYERLQEGFLHALEVISSDPFLVVNEEEDIVFFSTTARKLLGYTDKTLPSRLIDGGFLALFDKCPHKEKSTLFLEISTNTPFGSCFTDASLGMQTHDIGIGVDEQDRHGAMRGTIDVTNAHLSNQLSFPLASGDIRKLRIRFSELILPPDPSRREAPKRRYVIVYLLNEEEKEKEKNQLEVMVSLVDRSPTPMCIIDLHGTLLRVNAATEKMFRFDRSQLTGKNVTLLMPQRFATRHDTYIQQYLRTREKKVVGTTREVTAERKDGEQFHIKLSVNEVCEDGQPIMFIGCMEEVTPHQ